MWKGTDRTRSQMILTEYRYDPKAKDSKSVYLVRHNSRIHQTVLEQHLTIERDSFGRFIPTIELKDFPEGLSDRESMLKLSDWLHRLGVAIEDNWSQPMTKSTITREQTQQIIVAADEVITALAGTNEDVHPDDSKKMCELWDDLNDRHAPPVVVRELARMALAAMESEPVAWAWHYREQWHVTNDKCRAEFVAKDGDVAVLPLYRHAQPVPVVEREPIAWLNDAYLARGVIDGEAGSEDAGPGYIPVYREAGPQPAPGVPDDVLDALQKVARIRLDMNDFDGDRRGIADCLCDAEEALIEVVNRRAAMLAAAPQSHGSEPATVPGKWIPVSERMPEKGQAVLVYRPKAHEGGDPDVRVSVYGRHNFDHGFGCYWEPSHWMPLPAAPLEVKGE